MMKHKITPSLDIFCKTKLSILDNKRIGIISNQASVDSKLNHIVDIIKYYSKANLVKLFAPEHGFRGVLQDMECVESSFDEKTKLPVISLYGNTEETLSPQKKDFEDLDILLFDLKDVGTRYYTFSQTLMYTMKIAKKTNTKVIVLDAPNPINGVTVEGPPLLPKYKSFCGYSPIPTRHGLTMGELALLMNEGFSINDTSIPAINCDLEIIKMENWKRELYYDETSLPFVLPSPNLPSIDSMILYPGACLFEATNLSEGRGTTKPFEFVGAPYINSTKLIEGIKDLKIGLDGAILRETSFIPHYSKHKGTLCHGVQIHITNRKLLTPFKLALSIIYVSKNLYKENFSWRKETYEFIKDINPIDLLYGSDSFRKAVENSTSLLPIINEITTFEKTFQAKRPPLLLY